MATPIEALGAYRQRGARVSGRIQWFDQQVTNGLRLSMSKRLDLTAQLLRDKIVANISLPVERGSVGRGEGGRFTRAPITQRSVRGQFPRTETGRLMKDIFWDKPEQLRRIIGTSLDYGLWLEVSLDRSFLRRTLNEERNFVAKMLTRRVD